MAKINIPPIKGGFNLSQINNAFQRITDELNDKVHYRDNPEGEPNQIKTDVDMNGQRLYNLPKPTEDHEAARYEDFKAVEGSANKAHEQADRAEAEADRAEREADRAFDAAVFGGADNLKVYETLALATEAAKTLPDGQVVEVGGSRFTSSDRVLTGKTAISKLVATAYGGTVQDALLYVTPQMHTSTAGTGIADDSAAIQWAFDSGLPVQLGGFSYQASRLLASADKTMSVNGSDARIICTAAGGVEVKLRPGVDYFYGKGFRVIASGALSGDGLKIWSESSVAQGHPSVKLDDVYISRQDTSSGFNRALFVENVFQFEANCLHIRGSQYGALFDSCVSVRITSPDILFSDTGLKTLGTNRGCEGFRILGGHIYNNRVSMDIYRMIDLQMFGTHLLGKEKIFKMERMLQSAVFGGVWYCDEFDGTERDLISSHDSCRKNNFVGITVERTVTAIGHHRVFVANTGFQQNTVTGCNFGNMHMEAGADDNVLASILLESTAGVPNLTDLGSRNKKMGVVGTGVGSLGFGYSGANQISLTSVGVGINSDMTVNANSEFYGQLDLHQADAATHPDYDVRLSAVNSTGVAGGGEFQIRAASVRPAVDGGTSVGTAARRVSTFFGVTGTINTSDGREKTELLPIDDTILDAYGDVQYGVFQWLKSVQEKGDGARRHFGLIAQQLRAVFLAKGIDATQYGLLCYDEWGDEFEPVMAIRIDDSGQEEAYDTGERRQTVWAGNRWGIRSDQCLFLEAAYQRRRADRIEDRLDTIESKLVDQ